MGENISKDIACVLCQDTFIPVIEPEEGNDHYSVHCTSCIKGVKIGKSDPVRLTLKTVLNIKGEALALAVQTYLSDCPCGQTFSYDAGQRCPQCIDKIKNETRDVVHAPEFYCIWNIKKLKDLEAKVFNFILDRLDSEEETMTQLIDRYESGQIDPGTYMEGVENIQFREARDVSIIKTWAMLVGPEMTFRAAEEHGFPERYGSRILISLAAGLEMGYGTNILTTLSREEKNLDGYLQKEIQTFIKKIAGGF